MCRSSWIGLLLLGTTTLAAQELRYVQRDGILYRELVCRRWKPVTQIVYEQRQQTVYREEITTQMQEVTTVVRTPQVQWVWEPYWWGWWNPLRGPALAYRLVPRTVWKEEVRRGRVPVQVKRLVPHTQTVRVPVVRRRWVQEEVVLSRVPVAPSSPKIRNGPAPVQVAGRAIGGIQKLDSDPPRVSTIQWRPAQRR